MRRLGTLFAVAVCCTTFSTGLGRAKEPGDSEPGKTLVCHSGIPGGICVVAGCKGADLPLSLGEQGRFVVHALFQDEAELRRAREAIRNRGLYGRVSADACDLGRLPYADNLINLIVVERHQEVAPGGLSLDEICRVLAPLGVVYFGGRAADDRTEPDWAIGLREQAQSAGFGQAELVRTAGAWLKASKPWPADIDQWSHYLHAADGNPVADDRVVGPPEHYQWVAGPRWAQSHETDSSLRCLVTAWGRLYYIVNEAPTSLAGPDSPPDQWFLTARDAFNGVRLWKVPITEWGWRQWKPSWFTPRPGVIPINLDKRVVAAGDHLYATLGYRAPVSRLDGRTGEVLKTYAGTQHTSEILHHDGRLVLTVLEGLPSEGHAGCPSEWAARVKLVDAESGRHLWASENAYAGTTTDYYRFRAMRGSVPAAKVDPTLDIATDGEVVGLLDGDSVVCLDYATGAQRWRSAFPLVEADYTAGRINARQRVWTGTMIVGDGVLVHASPHQLAAFSADTGKVLWTQPKKFIQHLWYEWKDVFVIDGLVWTWSAQFAREKLEGANRSSRWPASLNGYDLHTGELKRRVLLGKIFKTHHHHRCYRNKATVRYILASRRGTEFVDLSGGEHSVHNWVRGTCHMGMMPANGLHYAPPHPCQCYIHEKLNGLNALAPARKEKRAERQKKVGRLEEGPAYPPTANPQSPTPGPGDWPTFRSDAGRSGSVSTRFPADMKLLWRVELGRRVAPPISVGQKVFVPLVDEHQLLALSATDGRVLWRFIAGARIDSPPTYDRGALLFGAADGWVYRVLAASGQLVWRFQAAPEDRRIAAFGQLESAWPVHGSVLVADGPVAASTRPVAYFAAGRSSHLDGGLRLFAIDARTGRVRQERKLVGPRYTSGNLRQNYLLPMGVLPDILRIEDAALFMRAVKFDMQLRRQQGRPTMRLRGGLLDDAYFKRMPWSMEGSGHARLLVHDGLRAYLLRMFDSLQGLNPKVYFTPGKRGYLLFAHDLKRGKNTWEQRIPIRGRAMVVTRDQLCVAGPPDVVDPHDPLAAFEGRKGGVLRIVDKGDGRLVSEHKLTSPPVFNGAAAAGGRLFLSLEDGSVACFGQSVSGRRAQFIEPRLR